MLKCYCAKTKACALAAQTEKNIYFERQNAREKHLLANINNQFLKRKGNTILIFKHIIHLKTLEFIMYAYTNICAHTSC